MLFFLIKILAQNNWKVYRMKCSECIAKSIVCHNGKSKGKAACARSIAGITTRAKVKHTILKAFKKVTR